MANPEHLAILKQGVEVWNKWREGNLDIRPDLTATNFSGLALGPNAFAGANFSDACLRDCRFNGVTLIGARFLRANLDNADFSRAILVFSDLSWASLSEAKFRRAYLTKAKLFGAALHISDLSLANCQEADLRSAVLTGTDFRGADLRDADIGEATLYEVTLGGTNLSRARGLETCRHLRGSTIDYRTILASWPIPVDFLRGCGLPDEFIRYIKSVAGKPIQFYSCFICYSTKDQEFAERVHSDLQNQSVRCWFAPHDIQGGKKIHEQIGEAIGVYDRLLLILSDHSMNSEWVKTEIANARQREIREKRQMLFPISLVPYEKVKEWEAFDADTGKDSAREIREYFIPDFSNWKDHDSYQGAFQRQLRDLKAA